MYVFIFILNRQNDNDKRRKTIEIELIENQIIKEEKKGKILTTHFYRIIS